MSDRGVVLFLIMEPIRTISDKKCFLLSQEALKSISRISAILLYLLSEKYAGTLLPQGDRDCVNDNQKFVEED